MWKRFLGSVIATVVFIAPNAALAQRGQQIFDFFLQQAQREAQQQQQLEFERRQRQELYRLRQEFVARWNACHQGDINACDQALQFPNVPFVDQQTLLRKRADIIAEHQENAERARRQRIEAELEHRRQVQEQEERERRERIAAEVERRRQQQEREQRAERDRVQELARLRAEAERIRQEREKEEHRLTELRGFTLDREACRNYDVGACEAALLSPLATNQDRTDFNTWRTVGLQLETDLASCEAKSVTACDAALALPALSTHNRTRVLAWRAEASPWQQAVAYLSRTATSIKAFQEPSHITTMLAAVLGLTLVVAFVRQPAAIGQAAHTIFAFPSAAGAGAMQQWRRLRRKMFRIGVRRRATRRVAKALAPPAPALALPVIERDTPAAMAALELAYAYIEEVRDTPTPDIEDEVTRKDHLNTLSLASKQIALAQKSDPDAVLELDGEAGGSQCLTINQIKALALFLEGATHQPFDTRRAIPALTAATVADPDNPAPFYLLGLTHSANHNKMDAIAALKCAVALDPRNLDYRKALNRAESLTGTEIAGYKMTRAGEKVLSAGIKTANAGIKVWNVGVVLWNIFAITWNIITFPARIVFAMFRFLRIPGF